MNGADHIGAIWQNGHANADNVRQVEQAEQQKVDCLSPNKTAASSGYVVLAMVMPDSTDQATIGLLRQLFPDWYFFLWGKKGYEPGTIGVSPELGESNSALGGGPKQIHLGNINRNSAGLTIEYLYQEYDLPIDRLVVWNSAPSRSSALSIREWMVAGERSTFHL